MKRVFCLIGFSYFITLTLLFFIPEDMLIYVSGVLFILFGISVLVSKFRNEKVLPLCMMTCLVAFTMYTVNYNLNIKPLKELDNQDAVISGKIIDLPYKQHGKFYYILSINKIDNQEVKSFKIRLSTPEPLEIDLYDEFKGKIHFYLPQNVPDFNFQSYYRSKGIYILAYAYNYSHYEVEQSKGLDAYYYVLKLKYKMLSTSRYLFKDSIANTMNGMFLGEKHNIPEEVKEKFDSVGTYHLVATSGIHISIISNFILGLLKKLKVNRTLSSIIASASILLFVALTGFSVSGLRAGIVTIICLIGIAIFKKSDSLNSLGVAVLIISLINPDSSLDIGLWLSALSSLGIILLEDKISTWIKSKINIKNNSNKFLDYIISIISVSLAVSIFNFPLVAFFYKKISILFIVSNVLVIPLATLLLNSLLVLNTLCALKAPSIILMPTALACGTITKLITDVSAWLSKIHFTFFSLDYNYISLCISFSLILIGIALIFKNWKRLLRISVTFSAIIFLGGILSYNVFTRNLTRMAIVNCMDGVGIVISKNLHKAVILYTNEGFCESRVNTYLSTSPFYFLDYIIINLSESINSINLNRFIEKYHPKITALPDNLSNLTINNSSTQLINFKGNISSQLWGNVSINNFEIENSNFIEIKINDLNFLVCCNGGDVSKIPEEKYKNCNLVIVGKLPLNYKYLNTNCAVLSMNREDAEIIINKLSDYEKIFSTSHMGNIYIDIDDLGNYKIRRSQ